MSWPEQKTEKRSCKIRKRGCSSSSSSFSSTLVFKYRFKKAPTWKMSTKSHSSNRSPSCSLDGGGGKGKEAAAAASVSVSARKSAANNSGQKLKNNNNNNNNNNSNSDVVEDKKELIKTRDLVSQISHHSCLSDPDPSFNNTKTEKVEGGRVQRRRRRSASCMRIGIVEEVGGSNFHGNHCLMEIENNGSNGKTTTMTSTTRRKTKFMVKTRLKEVSNYLTTSKELLRVLNHVWAAHEDQQDRDDQILQRPSSTLSLFTALKSELDRAKTRVDSLMKDHQSFPGDEIEVLMKRFAEEKAAWKYRERARVRSAISSMADEVEIEKKLRRQAERLNKTIAKELAHAKLSLSKALKDLQREKRAKEIFEQICDELAKGIGEDRAEFEELKKESAKVREEVEKEREMLQLADVLREERVQMKLCEAKYEFEEKNAAVERLKEELEAYFITQLSDQQEDNYSSSNKFDKIKELEAYLKKINFGSSCIRTDHDQDQDQDQDQIMETKNELDQEDDDDCCSDDQESDLHSIELNMDNNNKSYRWSFVQNGSQRNSFEKDDQVTATNGRKSLSEKIQWGSICLNRKPSNAKNSDTFDWDRFSDLFTHKLQDQHHHNHHGAADHETITHNNNNNNNKKSLKCLRDILFPGAADQDQNEVAAANKTGDDDNDDAIVAMVAVQTQSAEEADQMQNYV